MFEFRPLPVLAALSFICGCSADSNSKGGTGTGATSGGTVAGTTGAGTATASVDGGQTTTVTATASSSGTITSGSSASGTNANAAGGTTVAGAGGSVAAGGTSGNGSTGMQSTTTGSAGTGGTGSVMPRTECPAAPPAMQKAPAADRSLAVSKEDYAAMLTRETPFQGTRGQLPWHLYTPPQATDNPDQLFPLLVVLHGGYGREVTDGNVMVDVAQYLLGSQNGLLTEANRAAFPTYIVFPHCRVEEGCTFGSNEWASAGGAHYQIAQQPSIAGGTALELIEHVIDTYSVDPTRVYLTGNSMGGGGAWEFASRQPELFAAVLPVSGHPPALSFLAPIAEAKLPVWAFGGAKDEVNPYADTVEAIDTIAASAGCAWLTTYTETGHDDVLWSSPYLEPGLWSWLFAQSNPSAPR